MSISVGEFKSHVSIANLGLFLPCRGQAIRFADDGRTVQVVTGMDVSVWDTATWQRIEQHDLPYKISVNSISEIDVQGRFAVCIDQQRVELIDAKGKHLRTLLPSLVSEHGRIYCLSLSPDGRWCLVGCYDRIPAPKPDLPNAVIHRKCGLLIDTSSGQVVKTLIVRADVKAACFTTDCQRVALSLESKRVDCYSVPDGEKVWSEILGHLAFDQIAISHNDQRLIQQCLSCGLYLCDLNDGELLEEYLGTDLEHLNVMCFSPDDQMIAMYRSNGTVDLLDAKTLETIDKFDADPSKGWAGSIAFSPDGRTLLVASDDAIRPIDMKTKTLIGSSPVHQAQISHVVFSRDGETLITASADCIAVRDAGGTIQRRLRHEHAMIYMAYHPADLLAVYWWPESAFDRGGIHEGLRLLDLQTGSVVFSATDCKFVRFSKPYGFTPDGRFLIYSLRRDSETRNDPEHDEIVALDLATGEHTDLVIAPERENHGCYAYSTTKQRIAFNWGDSIRVLQVPRKNKTAWRLIRKIKLPLPVKIKAITLSPDGKDLTAVMTLLPLEKDRIVVWHWNVDTGQCTELGDTGMQEFASWHTTRCSSLELRDKFPAALLAIDGQIIPIEVPTDTKRIHFAPDLAKLSITDKNNEVQIYDIADQLEPYRAGPPQAPTKQVETPWLDEQLQRVRSKQASSK